MLHTAEKDNLEHQPLKIGSLLVNEGFVRKTDVAEALSIQKKEFALAEMPLGKLLVKIGAITTQQLQTLLEHPELRNGIGAFAVERGLIDDRQLADCIRRNSTRKPLDEVLISAGCITDEDLLAFLEQQLNSMKLCKLALHLDMVTQDSLLEAITIKRYQRTVGEILCDLNLITPLDLNAVLNKYRKHLRLGEILVKQGIIDNATLDMALLEQESRAEPLGNILLEKELLTLDELFRAFSTQYNVPFLKLNDFKYEPPQKEALSKIIGKTFSRQFRIVPMALKGQNLTVAISDPENLKVVHALRSKRVDLRTECGLVTEFDLNRLFEMLYHDRANFKHQKPSVPVPTIEPPPPDKFAPPTGTVKSKTSAESHPRVPRPPTPRGHKPAVASSPQKAKHIPPDEFVHLMLAQALKSGAQAIHIDRDIEGTTLRFRQDGLLKRPTPDWLDTKLPPVAAEVISIIKEMAGLDASDSRLPQDGVFRGKMVHQRQGGASPFDLSVTACPTLAGESIALKIIQPSPAAPTLHALGHSKAVQGSIELLLKQAPGMVIVAGPPISGKSASLYGILQGLNDPKFKAITVEDPIAYSLPGIVQTQVNQALAMNYPDLLRTAVRLDPDIVLAGDIPDTETAFWITEASRKGIRMLAGVQATDGASAITVLKNLGIAPRHLALHLKGILAQRSVRRICAACKQPYHPTAAEWQPLFDEMPSHLTFYKGTGCPECNFTGFNGQILISELLPLTDALSWSILQDKNENDLRHLAIRSGMKTLIDDGLSKLGETTLSEIVAVAPEESLSAYRCRKADAHLVADHGTDALVPADVKSNFLLLSRPQYQKDDIQRFYHAYKAMSANALGESNQRTQQAFETFITSNYSAVCQNFNVQKVSFSLYPRGAAAALILATPVFS